MEKNYIYIKLCNGINIPSIKLILKNKCNKIVFECFSNKFGKVKIPVYDKEVYRLIIISKTKKITIPLIAKKNETYCINISNNNLNNRKHFITIKLMDANYPNIRIKGGKMIIWQDIQSQ